MSSQRDESHDFSRQRFADFLAALIQARRTEMETQTQTSQQPSWRISPRAEAHRDRAADDPDSASSENSPFGPVRRRVSEPGSSN
jgi:hypothetical protein